MSEPIAWHWNTHLVDRRVIAGDVDARRLLARSVIRIGRDFDLVAFRCSGTHLHYLTFCSREGVGRMAQRVAESLRRGLTLPVGFATLFAKPVDTQRYLRTAFDYVVANTQRHEINYDPLHEASLLPDLLGLRNLGSYSRRLVRNHLPHVDRKHLLSFLGLTSLEPAEDLAWLAEAATAALALPDLRHRSDETTRARRALAHVAGERMSRTELSGLACTSPRNLRRLCKAAPDAELMRAIQLQVALRKAHAERLERAADPLLASESPASYELDAGLEE